MYCIIMILLSVLTSIYAVVRIITAAITPETCLVTITIATTTIRLLRTRIVSAWTTCCYACAPSISTFGIKKQQQNMN